MTLYIYKTRFWISPDHPGYDTAKKSFWLTAAEIIPSWTRQTN